MSYNESKARYMSAAMAAGMSYGVANAVRRDAQRLHTIAERECNGDLTRAEAGDVDHKGRPLIVGACYTVGNINGPGPLRYYRTPDRETGCIRRIGAAAASIGAHVEYQGDPRGWPVTITLADGRTLNPPCR